MREQLEKEIIRRFGPCYGSKRCREQLREIITNALDRYDEEIRNGAASNDAYQIALSSIGSFKDLRRTLGAVKRRNAILFSILGFVTTAILIVCALYGLWMYFVPIAVCAAIGFAALYNLLSGRTKAKRLYIVTVAICGAIIAYLVFILAFTLPFVIMGTNERNQSVTYDYREQAASIESVSYVQITDIAYGEETDTLDYNVRKAFGNDQTTALLNDLGSLPYRRYENSPRALKTGDFGFLIRFDPEASDLLYALYCEHVAVVVKRTPTGIRVSSSYSYCKPSDWNRLLETYLPKENDNQSF